MALPKCKEVPETAGPGCSSNGGGQLDVPGLEERLRTQTLARYFTPAQITRDTIQSSHAQPIAPTLSTNTHLTGLAQNGALKLNCDRAFISLLDTSTQYIIAEATRSISLRKNDHYSTPQDALFLGVQALPKSYGVCPNTVNVFTDTTGERAVDSKNVVANTSRYVIRDFRDMEDYKNKPYVVGFPYMRSYAEVPLKTSDGHVIGSFCVVDSVVRDDFFEEEPIFVLDEVASSIMEHLELVTVRHNHDRGERLMEGLSLFAEGKSCFIDGLGNPATVRKPLSRKGQHAIPNDGQQPHLPTGLQIVPTSHNETKVVAAIPNDWMSSTAGKRTLPTDCNDPLEPQTTPTTPPVDVTQEAPSSHSFEPAPGILEESAPPSVYSGYGHTFSRAANLIRQAMDVDGLVFLDASPGSPSATGNGAQSIPTADRVSDTECDDNDDKASQKSNRPSVCPVLGSSISSTKDAPNQDSYHCPFDLHERSLRRLTRDYPRGHVFSADKHGVLIAPHADHDHSANGAEDELRNASHKYIPAELRRFLSTTHSVIFYPLWDFSKARFFAGLLAWTTDPTRMFEREDFTCLSAFGDSVMTELARLEAVDLSRAKSDFISSVSHELRSPLHGILASAELLNDVVTNDSQSELVRMIDSCGNTLLDTFNHLLDFAKLNSFDNSKGHARNAVKGRDKDEQGQTVMKDLAELVEDVVEGVYLGHISRKAAHQMFESRDSVDTTLTALSFAQRQDISKGNQVAVTVDIEKRSDWTMPLRVGAWKRVVMNLFANSLKYTACGHIHLTLKRVKNLTASDQDSISLVVSDTGIGMSPDYLKHKLFKPFAQENSMTDGTGLGLSIVNQIVSTFGGTIDVQSKAKEGTRIEVLAPINSVASDSREIEIHSPSVPDAVEQLRGQKLCLVGFDCDVDEQPSNDRSPKARRQFAVAPLISNIASEWFQMKVSSAVDLDAIDADIYVVEASSMADLAGACTSLPTQKRLLAVGSEFSSMSGTVNVDGMSMTHIKYPIGPRTLGKALLASLKAPNQQTPTREASATGTIDKSTSLGLPLRPISQHQASAENIEPAFRGQPKRHLLLVDDNVINMKILGTYVKKLGCTYETAENGLKAFELYKSSPKHFDIIFMDISMPVMNGFEASYRIRDFELANAAHRSHRTRIIALTGLGSEESRQEATTSGIDEFRIKPVPLKDLKAILDAT